MEKPKRNEYRTVILSMAVWRRFERLLEPTRQAVLEEFQARPTRISPTGAFTADNRLSRMNRMQMNYVFNELILACTEQSNEETWEHSCHFCSLKTDLPSAHLEVVLKHILPQRMWLLLRFVLKKNNLGMSKMLQHKNNSSYTSNP